MNNEVIQKQIADRMQKLWDQQITPLVEQLNSELARVRLAQDNIEKIKADIAKRHKELIETANQLAQAYAAVPGPVIDQGPAKK